MERVRINMQGMKHARMNMHVRNNFLKMTMAMNPGQAQSANDKPSEALAWPAQWVHGRAEARVT